MASSTLRIDGLWLPTTSSLNCGMNSKKSWRMKRAVILSPPVSALSLLSAQRLPCSVSIEVTILAPRKPAMSVGWRSPVVAMNMSMGATVA